MHWSIVCLFVCLVFDISSEHSVLCIISSTFADLLLFFICRFSFRWYHWNEVEQATSMLWHLIEALRTEEAEVEYWLDSTTISRRLEKRCWEIGRSRLQFEPARRYSAWSKHTSNMCATATTNKQQQKCVVCAPSPTIQLIYAALVAWRAPFRSRQLCEYYRTYNKTHTQRRHSINNFYSHSKLTLDGDACAGGHALQVSPQQQQ